MIKLGVLDQSPVRVGATYADAINESVELARATEKLGYSRYWVAEHHAADGFAGSAPEILVGRIAGATDSIRVGSGGVMLSHYSPYKVAETFRVLEVLYPGRIDLGIGRAPGRDRHTAVALAYGNQLGIEYFPNKVLDLRAFLSDEKPVTEALHGIRATPESESDPELWILGSSAESARMAAQFGIRFSFAHFINPYAGGEVSRAYRTEFEPTDPLPAPRTNVGVFAICADTEEEATRLAKSRDLWRLRADQGRLGQIPTVEEAESTQYTPAEKTQIEHNRIRYVVGDPDQVKARLTEIAEEHQAEELVLLTITPDYQSRLRSYELVAKAFGVQGEGNQN